MIKFVLVDLIIVILITLLFNGCLDAFNPFCPTPDTSKITANRGTTGTGGMVIIGDSEAVEPEATVMVADNDGNTATTIADENGFYL